MALLEGRRRHKRLEMEMLIRGLKEKENKGVARSLRRVCMGTISLWLRRQALPCPKPHHDPFESELSWNGGGQDNK